MEVDDLVRILKTKYIFANGYTPNWCEDSYAIKKPRNPSPWTNVIEDLNGKETIEIFHKK